MIVLSALYQLLIAPLELFFEVLFSLAFRIIGDPGLSIVFLSLAMNILVLPLYRRADAMQQEERERMARMKPWTDHIKKTFKGDERFMMLQTYNRQNGYKQTDVLKGSISLLLEIPFFIAAFHFLSNLQLLNGVSFGPIADLGAPDAFLQLGDISINVLPIVMTVINLISAAIYMKGLPAANKVQMYGVAAIFLALLYNSPAGLVFYWTLNNVFSLVKNIFYKIRNPKLVLAILLSIVGIAVPIAAVYTGVRLTTLRMVALAAFAIGLQIPLLLHLRKKPTGRLSALIPEASPQDDRIFLFACIFSAILLGALIPTSVIISSPAEFVEAAVDTSPLFFVFQSSLLAFGLFVVWFGVFYRLATPKGRTIFACMMFVFSVAAIVNYIFFGTDYGNLSTQLTYDSAPHGDRETIIINLVVLSAVAIALYAVWMKKRSIAKVGSICLCVAALAMTAINVTGIATGAEDARALLSSDQNSSELKITLSRSGKNVVVIMMDRGIANYIPYLMYEKPELKEMFEGFTFYPNAISYGAYTNTGAPAIYGGPEYRPEQMNARDLDSLADKHNEALKVMPTLFSENGFRVEVIDPTYAGYSWVPDLSIFDEIPGVNAYLTSGRFDPFKQFSPAPDNADGAADEKADALLPRSFFCYSLFRVAPVALHPTLYNHGDYNSASYLSNETTGDDLSRLTSRQVRKSESVATGVSPSFMKAYAVLQNLPMITDAVEGNDNHFVMMSNDATHEPCVLKEPEYVPELRVDNTEYDEKHRYRYAEDGSYLYFEPEKKKNGPKYASKTLHYEINMASLYELGKWFDFMRENEVFDNTRIVIVSDHSRFLHLDPDLLISIGDDAKGDDKVTSKIDMLTFNCLLMVKDFNSREYTTDDRFMTNADTPALALDGLVENPKNPFTGNSIDEEYKSEPEQHLVFSPESDVTTNNGNVFLPGYWFGLSNNNVFAKDNWRYLGKY